MQQGDEGDELSESSMKQFTDYYVGKLSNTIARETKNRKYSNNIDIIV